jgi:hypothetical protein
MLNAQPPMIAPHIDQAVLHRGVIYRLSIQSSHWIGTNVMGGQSPEPTNQHAFVFFMSRAKLCLPELRHT